MTNATAATVAGEKHINIVMAICLQNDFIGPKGLVSDRIIQEAGLSLHGGAKASQRILGKADGPTPIDDMLVQVHGDDNTYVLYIPDLHVDDPSDPEMHNHFATFGPHCIEGTDGAKPVGNIEMLQQQRRAQVIPTKVLNLITHPPIVDAITSIIHENEIDDPSQVNFLFVGGLTDILISDAARGLSHICGIPNPYREGGENWTFFGQIGVSSAYCFSNFASEHESALRSMAKVRIHVLKTDAEILRFLKIQG